MSPEQELIADLLETAVSVRASAREALSLIDALPTDQAAFDAMAPIGRVASFLVPLVDAFLIVLGLLLLAGRNPFNRLPGMAVPVIRNPYGQAYVYGMMLGPIAWSSIAAVQTCTVPQPSRK